MKDSEMNKVAWVPEHLLAKISFFIFLISGFVGFIFTGNGLFLIEMLLASLLSPKVYVPLEKIIP